jgi:S1-C subfamily serine protease
MSEISPSENGGLTAGFSVSAVARACMVAFGLALVLLCLVACGDRAAGASAALPAQQQVNLAVVAIDARIGGDVVHSSGTVMDANRGLVLTSNRGVWGATSLRIGTALGLVYGRVVARAPCDDLALVEMFPQLPGLVALPRAAGVPAPGQLVTSVGRRRVAPDLASESLLQIPALRAAARGTTRITLDGRLVPEALGGPLIDPHGRLVGIAQAGLGRLPAPSRALSSTAIENRLRRLHPGPRSVYVGWRSQYGCAGRLTAAVKAEHPAFKSRDAWLNAPVPATRLPGTEVLDTR